MQEKMYTGSYKISCTFMLVKNQYKTKLKCLDSFLIRLNQFTPNKLIYQEKNKKKR